MRREAQEIVTGLYLGPFQASTNLVKLKTMGITHMCVDEAWPKEGCGRRLVATGLANRQREEGTTTPTAACPFPLRHAAN